MRIVLTKSARNMLYSAFFYFFSQTAYAAGPINIFSIGNWVGGAYTNDASGDFSHCVVSTPYLNGVTFLVARTKDSQWNIGLVNKMWAFKLNEQTSIRFLFDGKESVEAVSLANAPDTLYFLNLPSSSFIKLFRNSQFLDVSIRGSFFKFKLDGTSKVLSALENCVSSSRLSVRSAPVGPQVPATLAASDIQQHASRGAGQHELEAVRMATNFLLRAEIRGAKLLNRHEIPINFSSYDAVWRSADLIGGVKILATDLSVKGIDVAASIVGEDSKDCRGKFASGRVSELVDSDVVFRGFSSCEESSGLRVSQYFIVPRRNSGFGLFSVSSSSKDRDIKIDKEDQLFKFRRAALVSFTE